MTDEQKMLMEYESYRGQLEVFKKNVGMIDASLAELGVAKTVLDSIGVMDEKNEVLVPIGAGSFVNARVVDTKNVILDLGANVAAKKSLKEAKEDLEGRFKMLEGAKRENLSELQRVARKLEELSPEVEEIVAKMQG